MTALLIGLASLCTQAQSLPETLHGLHYTEPARVWDEAFPLGNGFLGALVWGDGHPLNISLDRTDLWDLRPVPEFYGEQYKFSLMRQWEKEGRYDELIELYEKPYHRPAPTKIPAGRITLTLPSDAAFQEGRLSIDNGMASASFQDGSSVRVWIHAEQPVGMIAFTGEKFPEIQLQAPAFGGSENDPLSTGFVMGDLAQLGYPAPQKSAGKEFLAYEQQGWQDFSFAVHLCWTRSNDGFIAAWSIASRFETDAPAVLARERAEAALNRHADLRAPHDSWWRNYWNQGRIQVPDPIIERQWYLDMYKFGAATRRDAPPITLQGPWTADDGKLPPWKGDYHHDLNTQLSYWPCYSGNRLDAGLGFLDWLWTHRENARDWTKRFFEMPGLNVPMTTDLELKQIGGWRQYTHSATTAAWLAHHFYLHWQYSRDRRFLEERAFPWLEDCAVFLEAVTSEPDANGLRTLPLSSSPEINDNKPNAWFPSMTNYDCALIRWTFEKTAELAQELGNETAAQRWRQTLSEMPLLRLDDTGALLVADAYPLKESHRHFSHLMAIHPLGLIDRSQGTAATQTIAATLADLQKLGTDWWTGYSFSWLASAAARAGDGEYAAWALKRFASAFVLRNSFHCNGDQSGKGYSKFTYRPFTLEGNFACPAGLNEMLLQSQGDCIELFPAIPDSWKEASFTRLRATGAFLVSAELKNGRVAAAEIHSETGAVPRIKCPWTGQIGALDSDGIKGAMTIHQEGNTWHIAPPS